MVVFGAAVLDTFEHQFGMPDVDAARPDRVSLSVPALVVVIAAVLGEDYEAAPAVVGAKRA